MAEHPAVTFLTAKVARVEETARAATKGPWKAHRYTWDGDGFEASIGHYSEADVVGHGYEGGGVVAWADAVFIEANHPSAVLRLVAGARQILAEHANDGYGDCVRCAGGHEIEIGECMTVTVRDALPYPCRTVLRTAQAWGWTEENA